MEVRFPARAPPASAKMRRPLPPWPETRLPPLVPSSTGASHWWFRGAAASGPLHWQVSLPGPLFPGESHRGHPSPPPRLCLAVTFLTRPCPAAHFQSQPPPALPHPLIAGQSPPPGRGLSLCCSLPSPDPQNNSRKVLVFKPCLLSN